MNSKDKSILLKLFTHENVNDKELLKEIETKLNQEINKFNCQNKIKNEIANSKYEKIKFLAFILQISNINFLIYEIFFKTISESIFKFLNEIDTITNCSKQAFTINNNIEKPNIDDDFFKDVISLYASNIIMHKFKEITNIIMKRNEKLSNKIKKKKYINDKLHNIILFKDNQLSNFENLHNFFYSSFDHKSNDFSIELIELIEQSPFSKFNWGDLDFISSINTNSYENSKLLSSTKRKDHENQKKSTEENSTGNKNIPIFNSDSLKELYVNPFNKNKNSLIIDDDKYIETTQNIVTPTFNRVSSNKIDFSECKKESIDNYKYLLMMTSFLFKRKLISLNQRKKLKEMICDRDFLLFENYKQFTIDNDFNKFSIKLLDLV